MTIPLPFVSDSVRKHLSKIVSGLLVLIICSLSAPAYSTPTIERDHSPLLDLEKEGSIVTAFIHVVFPNTVAEHQDYDDYALNELPNGFANYFHLMSREQHHITPITICDPAIADTLGSTMWMADFDSRIYGDSDSLSVYMPESWSEYWCGSSFDFHGALQAEIFNKIEIAYDAEYGAGLYTSPFSDVDIIKFVLRQGKTLVGDDYVDDYPLGFNIADSPVGGIGHLSLSADCFNILTDAPTEDEDDAICPLQVFGTADIWFNPDSLRGVTNILAHEYCHAMGLSGASHLPHSHSDASLDAYHCGPYGVMQAVQPSGHTRFAAIHPVHLWKLGWIPDPIYVKGDSVSLRVDDIFDAASNGQTILVKGHYEEHVVEIPDHPDATLRGEESYLINFYSSGNPYNGVPSSGLAVWHLAYRYSFYGDQEPDIPTPSMWGSYWHYIDLETRWGRFSDPVNPNAPYSINYWQNSDHVNGYDRLDNFIDVHTVEPRVNYGNYMGSSDDLFTIPGVAMSHETTPSTNQMTALDEYVTSVSHYSPQDIDHTLVINIDSIQSDHAIISITQAPREKMTHPAGGEIIFTQQPLEIQWGDDHGIVDVVDIDLSLDGGSSFPISIATSVPDTGSYTWTPESDHAGESAVLRLTSHNYVVPEKTSTDVTSSLFTILPGSPVVYENQSAYSMLGLDEQDSPYSSVLFDQNGDNLLDYFVAQKAHAGVYFESLGIGPEGILQFDYSNDEVFNGDPNAGLRGVSTADYDNDGLEDLFMAHRTNPKLYRNTGTGFDDVTASLGISIADSSWAGVWGDYNRDGWVDLYICRAGGVDGIDPDSSLPGLPDLLLLNDCARFSGGFQDASWALGSLQYVPNTSITASWADFDQDGDLDLLVPSLADNEAPRLFVNQDDGLFEEEFSTRFGSVVVDQVSSITWADIDSDGDLDLALSNQAAGADKPYLFTYDQQNGTFADRSSSLPSTGEPTLAVQVVDHDLNGQADLLMLPVDDSTGITQLLTGHVIGPLDELHFLDETSTIGLDDVLGRVDGVSVADLNFDGDPDLLLGRPESDNGHFYRATDVGGGNNPSNNWVGVVTGHPTLPLRRHPVSRT